MYGSDASSGEFAARPVYRLPQISYEDFSRYVQKCTGYGLEFNYTMNALYCGTKREISIKYNQIKSHIRKIIDSGVTSITISNPVLAEVIRSVSDEVKIAVSTIAHIDAVSQVKLWKEYYNISKVYGNISKNRSIKFLTNLSSICQKNDIDLCLLVNEFCYNGSFSNHHDAAPCIFRDSCFLFHSRTSSAEEDMLLDKFPMNRCMKSRMHPETWLKSRFIRPEDIYLYENIGITSFKVTGRTASTNFISTIVGAYLDRKWEGNLLALWKPLETIFRFHNSEFEFDHEIFIDNKKLDGFLSFWFDHLEHECSNEICGETCKYCESFAKSLCRS